MKNEELMILYGSAALEKEKSIVLLSLEDPDNCKMLINYMPNNFRSVALFEMYGEYFLATVDHSKNYNQLKGISEEEAQRRINGFLDEKELKFGRF